MYPKMWTNFHIIQDKKDQVSVIMWLKRLMGM